MTDDREQRLAEIRDQKDYYDGLVQSHTPDHRSYCPVCFVRAPCDVYSVAEDALWLLAEVERLERRANQLESCIGEPMLDQIDGRSRPGSIFTVNR